MKDCLKCKTHFRTLQPNTKFCRPCRTQKFPSASEIFNISHNTVGYLSEHIICADLLKKGFDVFRSIHAVGCKFDICAFKNGKVYKIEVRTGFISGEKIMFPQQDIDVHDFYAVVCYDEKGKEKIFYFPDLPE